VQTIRVVDWPSYLPAAKKTQNYSAAWRPSWVKVETSLLGNDAFAELSLADVGLYVRLVLASAEAQRGTNDWPLLPTDPRLLGRRLGMPLRNLGRQLERLSGAGLLEVSDATQTVPSGVDGIGGDETGLAEIGLAPTGANEIGSDENGYDPDEAFDAFVATETGDEAPRPSGARAYSCF
jgi:hypothetical protein